MAIARDQTANSASGGQQSTPLTLTIPVATAVGSCLWFMGGVALGGGGSPTMTVTSTGSSLTQVDTLNVNAAGCTSSIYKITSTTVSDQGATISLTPSGNCFIGMSLVTYTGALTSQPDVEVSGSLTTNSTTFTAPSTTTNTSGDWAVFFASFLAGGAITGYPGTFVVQDSASRTSIADSNGSVGAAGTTIGGGTWTANASARWIGFTLGMAPGGGPALTTDAVTLAAPLLTPAIGPDPLTSAITLAAPVPSLAFGAASIPLPVAAVTLSAPPLVASGGQPSALPLDPDVAGGFFQSQQSPQGPPLGWGYIR